MDDEHVSTGMGVRLAVVWLIVAIPMGYGIVETVKKAVELF